MLGVCGALQEGLEIGDFVIPNRILQHDSLYSGNEGFAFVAPGDLYLTKQSATKADPFFYPDAKLSNYLGEQLDAASEANVATGIMLSGSEFAASVERKKILAAISPEVVAVDMETAALAQVAKKFKTPFAVVKTVADTLQAKQSSISAEFKATHQSAALNAASALEFLL